MRYSLICLLLTLSWASKAQSPINQETIGAAGETMENVNGTFEFTVGQPVILTISGLEKQGSFTQGFQQSFYSIEDISDTIDFDFEITIWPNPADEFISLAFPDLKTVLVQVIDGLGAIRYESLVQNHDRIDISNLAAAMYTLRVYDTISGKLKIYRLVKI